VGALLKGAGFLGSSVLVVGVTVGETGETGLTVVRGGGCLG